LTRHRHLHVQGVRFRFKRGLVRSLQGDGGVSQTYADHSVEEGHSGAQFRAACRRPAGAYADLDDRASGPANGLAAIVPGPGGDPVALSLGKQLEYPEIDLGLAYGGAQRLNIEVRLEPYSILCQSRLPG
jgi:hypothetical protein